MDVEKKEIVRCPICGAEVEDWGKHFTDSPECLRRLNVIMSHAIYSFTSAFTRFLSTVMNATITLVNETISETVKRITGEVK